MFTYSRRLFVKNVTTVLASTQLPATLIKALDADHVEYDVTVFGAGSSGLYAAHRLRELGYSVLILESSNRLGGHSETYKATDGKHIDPGVRMYPDEDLIKAMLSKYDIPYSNFSLRGGKQVMVDFKSNRLSQSGDPSKLGIYSGIQKFLRLYESKFPFIVEPGFNLPTNVPTDLLMPFSAFLQKHKISNRLAPMVNYLQGFGDVANMTTLYALKNLKPVILNNAKKDSFIAPDLGVEELYKRIGRSFGENIQTGIKTNHVKRTGKAVHINYLDNKGRQVNVKAKYVFISFPPLLKNLELFDLSQVERNHFSKFKYSKYYTSLLETNKIPKGHYYSAHGEKGFLHAVNEPSPYVITDTPLKGISNILYGMETAYRFSDEEIKRKIKKHVEELSRNLYGKAWTLNDFVLFKNHSPYALKVDSEDIKNGFYAKMTALQGERGLFYIGAAMDTHGTFSVWSHVESLLKNSFPAIKKSAIMIKNG